jgi:hypothetical protein
MKPSVRIGRIFGVEVGIHWSVLVIAGLLAFGLTGGVGDVALWAAAIVAVVLFLGSLLAHELAHSVVARRNGMDVKGITLWLLGGVAQLGGPMPSAGAELRVAAAGPATSIALGAGFLVLAVAGAASGVISSLVVSVFAWVAFVNVVLAVFNLIPAARSTAAGFCLPAVAAARRPEPRRDRRDPCGSGVRVGNDRPRCCGHVRRHPVRHALDRVPRLVHPRHGHRGTAARTADSWVRRAPGA